MPEVLTAEQAENEVLIANSFPDHEGRPGERGGSLPRGEAAEKTFHEKQTETPEFKAWFGDSKVVDKDGKPLFDPSQELYGNVSENSWKQVENTVKETDLVKTQSGLYNHQETVDSVLAKIPPQLHTPEVKDEINDLVAKKELEDALPYDWDDIDRAKDEDSETKKQSKSFAAYVVDSEQILKQAGYGNSGSTFHGSWYISAPDGYTISIRDHENTAVGGTSFSDQVLIDNASRFGSVSQGLDDALDKFTQRRYDKWEEKIKSAIGNKGTWSRTDPNIVNELAANAALDFPTALIEHQVRPFVPTSLSHAEMEEQVEPQIRERALMMARVTNAEYGEKVRELCAKIENGQESLAHARTLLGRLAAEMGYEAPAGKEGTIEDLGSDARINLILRTQVEMADGYGQWKGRQDAGYLEDFPCLEFYRAFDRKEPRDWPARWEEAGGEFFDGDSDYAEGRMIAPANSPIWEAISAFGTPYPPFDFNSGMMTEPVSREEAVNLGVLSEGDMVHPQQRDFAKDASASVKGLSGDMEQVLLESLGGGWETVDGFLVKANERMIDQLANSILIANSFPGHAGRPGMRGGSAPSGGQVKLEKSDREKLSKQGLFLHGTSHDFSVFKQGGHGAIYLSDPSLNTDKVTQAEHIASGPFGGRLIAVKVDDSKLKRFDQYNDPVAKKIFRDIYPSPDAHFIDYTDMPKFVEKAGALGYNDFKVYEPSVQSFSRAITEPKALKVVELKNV